MKINKNISPKYYHIKMKMRRETKEKVSEEVTIG
jgi:hypothetical protein